MIFSFKRCCVRYYFWWCLFLATYTLAKKAPNAEINIQISHPDDDSYTGKFQPSIKWETDGSWNNIEYQGGFSMKAEDLNTANFPCQLWGSARKTVGSWKLQTNLASRSDYLEALDVDFIAKTRDVSLIFQGSVGNRYAQVHELALSKRWEAPGGFVKCTPRYNTHNGLGVLLDYDLDDTTVSLDADRYKQRIKVSRDVGDNTLAPSISSDGEVELQYRRYIRNDGILDIHYVPKVGTTFRYQHGAWDVHADFPMDGFSRFSKTGVHLGFRRSVTLPSYQPNMAEEMESELQQEQKQK